MERALLAGITIFLDLAVIIIGLICGTIIWLIWGFDPLLMYCIGIPVFVFLCITGFWSYREFKGIKEDEKEEEELSWDY